MIKNLTQRYYLFLLISIWLLLITTIVYAENTVPASEEESTQTETEITNSKTNETTPDSNTEVTETTTKEKPESQATEPEDALSDGKQKRLINLSANISNRLDAVILRHSHIIKRLERRIAKTQAEGFNTTPAETELKKAIQSNTSAQEEIKNIDNQVYQTFTSTQPILYWASVKETYLKTENSIKETQQNLRGVVALLKNPTTTRTSEEPESPENESTNTNTNHE